MKKKLITLAFLIAFLISGALFFAPRFLNYETLGPKISSALKQSTGMDLDVKGDFSLSFFPSPHLSLSDVVLKKEGVDALYIKDVSIQLKLFSLLRGDYLLDQVIADKVIITLIRHKDGTWNLAHKSKKVTGDTAQNFKLNWLSLTNAEVLFIDEMNNKKEKFENIELGLALGSLSGPFKLQGKTYFHKTPYTFRVESGVLSFSTPSEFSVLLTSDKTGLNAQYVGQLHRKPTHTEHQGAFKFYVNNTTDLDDLSQLLLNKAMSLPAPLSKGVALDANIKDDGVMTTVKDISMNLSDVVRVTGDVAVSNQEVTVNELKTKWVGDTSLHYSGTFSQGDMKGKVELSSKTLWRTLDAFGLPRITPDRLSLKANIKKEADKIVLDQINGISDEGKVLGALDFQLGERPAVKYDLSFGKLDMRHISEGQKGVKKTLEQKLKSLVAVDASGKLAAEKFFYDGGQVKGLATDLVLDKGALTLGVDIREMHKRPFNANIDLIMVNDDVAGMMDVATTVLQKPFIMSSKFNVNADDFSFSQAALTWDGIAFNGQGRLLRGGQRPIIDASASAYTLPLSLFKNNKKKVSADKSVPGDKWSSEPFDFSLFKAVDLALSVKAKKFILGDDFKIEDSDIYVQIIDQYLKEFIIEGRYGGGSLRNTLSIDPREGSPKWHATVAAEKVNLSKTALQKHLNDGQAAMTLNVKSKGSSVREVISNLEGMGRLQAENALIKGFDLNVLRDGMKNIGSTEDVSKLFSTAFKKGNTSIKKLEIPFEVKRGIINATSGITAGADVWRLENGLAFINLLQKEMDVRGDIKLNTKQDLPAIGIRWYGKLNKPSYTLRIRSLENFIKKKLWDLIKEKLE